MLGLLAAGALLAVCVLVVPGKARAAEYDPETRTVQLDADEAAACAAEGGCHVITARALAQANYARALLGQAGAVVEQLGAEVAKSKAALAACRPQSPVSLEIR